MAVNTIKSLAKAARLYPFARWINRHVLQRADLRIFREQCLFYRQLIGPGTLCFDVGANVGTKTEVFLHLGARVVAFEPQMDCLNELQARLGRNRSLVKLQTALGRSCGSARLYVHAHPTSSSLLPDWEDRPVDTVTVPLTTLDEAVAQYGVPDYCKIDVEGYELEVLRGLNQPLPLISFEFHRRANGITEALKCISYLGQFGSISINLIGAEIPSFASAEWMMHDEFVRFFCDTVPGLTGYDYGDIFIRRSCAMDGNIRPSRRNSSSYLGSRNESISSVLSQAI